MDYKEYLASDEWKAKRTKVRRRARGWCERCKVRRRVDVHHLSYAHLGNEPLTDLVAVCRECHKFLHGQRETDPASLHYTKEEVAIARKLAWWADQGEEDRICELHPEFQRVREKLQEA